MALFTDGPISCILDLTARDTQLLNVAVAEGIDVTQRNAVSANHLRSRCIECDSYHRNIFD